ncbi:NAD(P)-binding protein [Mycena rosella]|uniref:NAD(P)-binding protein n=1 Tax=Mycena rosella TaxID=1033263 RepID=A0AAD7G929_MYCRO|nr:NAD(P)-binding protein [Mycena rosella]
MSQSFPPKAKWWQKDIPDLTGKVIIVTGAKSGIGKETVKALLQHNAKVYLAARGREDSERVIKDLKKITGKEALFLELDLANLAGVRKAADEFLSKETELHVLFNNAGVMFPELDMLTKDGYDTQWGVHVLGAHLFTKILMPALIAGGQSSGDGKARIITTSSSGAYMEKDIHWDTFKPGKARTAYGKQGLYFQSKLAQVIWTIEIAKRYGDQNIIALSLNPGNLQTNLQRHQGAVTSFLLRAVLHPVDPYGPLTQLWGGTSADVLKGENGAFLAPWARYGPTPPGALEPGVGQKLWDYLEKEVEKY